MLAPLSNGVIFKKVFADEEIFNDFIQDVLGIDQHISKIETEKKFSPKVSGIDIAYDIFAESDDHRVIIEIQRVEYDHNFDRFLHYHMMAIAEQQRRAKDYSIDQTVYTIVFLTAPYKVVQKTGKPIRDDVLISEVDPRNLKGEKVEIYGHKLIFLNPEYRNEQTPSPFKDWLDLVYESIHNQKNYQVNLKKKGIKKAVDLIDFEHLSPVEMREMKEHEGRLAVLAILENRAQTAEANLEDAKQQVADAKQQVADAKQQVADAKQQSEEEKQRAEEAEKKNDSMIKQMEAMQQELERLRNSDSRK